MPSCERYVSRPTVYPDTRAGSEGRRGSIRELAQVVGYPGDEEST